MSSNTSIRKTAKGGVSGSTSATGSTTTTTTPIMNKPKVTKKKIQQRKGASIGSATNLLFIFLVGFILIWLGVYEYVFPSLTTSLSKNIRQRIVDHHHHDLLDHNHDHEEKLVSPVERASHKQLPPKAADSTIIKHNNPYEGWQPQIHVDSEGYGDKCKSWRTCSESEHHCPGKCRDGLDDFGKAPLPPTSSGGGGFDQYGDDEDNKEKKKAGQGQWIPDVTVLRRMMIAGKDLDGNVWPPPLVTETDRELCEDIGVFGGTIDDNKKLLNINGKPYIRGIPLVLNDDNDPRLAAGKKQPKILCMVYTMEENHHTSIRAIRETWGGGCDGFLAFSTKDDPRIPAISLEHDGPEEYGNMWQKVRSIWRFVGKHYLDEFDFFFQGGEDLYVLPQNLRQYLATAVDDPTKDDFFGGRRFQINKKIFFNSGGAGYALSQATLRKFVDTGLDHPKCFVDKHTATEDVMIARCLKDVFDIGLVDTRDSQDRERFHPFSPGSHYSWQYPIPPARDWYESYNRLWPIKLKEQCCAPDSVSFHYMRKPAMVRHIHSLLYFCD